MKQVFLLLTLSVLVISAKAATESEDTPCLEDTDAEVAYEAIVDSGVKPILAEDGATTVVIGKYKGKRIQCEDTQMDQLDLFACYNIK